MHFFAKYYAYIKYYVYRKSYAYSMVIGLLGSMIAQVCVAAISHAQPVVFCHLHPDNSGLYSYHDGGGLINPNLPAQFLNPEQEKYLSFGDNHPLNTDMYTLKPVKLQTGTNCSTDLRGLSVNPGGTTIIPDSQNYGIKIGTNSTGYSPVDTQQLLLTGIRYGSNSGFGFSR